MGIGRLATVFALLLLTGCNSGAFACEDDQQCGANGHCELIGYCSFPDGTCESGRRFGDLAGGGFAGLCVVPDDATSSETVTTMPVTSATSTTSPATTEPPTTSPVDESGESSSSSTGYDASPVTVGADINQGAEANHWPGGIDDVRLYARALTEDEITALAVAPE